MDIQKSSQKVFVLLFFLLNFQIVSAFEIESYKITATPSENSVANSIEIMINNTKTTALTQGTLHLAKDATIESIRDSYGTLLYSVTEEEEDQKVSFAFSIPVQPNEARVVTLETKTHNVVQKGGYFEYLLVLVPSTDIENFIHIVKLDQDVVLYSTAKGEEEDYLIVPDATVSETPDNIIIQWQSALTKDTPAVFLVRFAQETGIDYWMWTAIFLLTLILGVELALVHNTFMHIVSNRKHSKQRTSSMNERKQFLRLLSRILKLNNTTSSNNLGIQSQT